MSDRPGTRNEARFSCDDIYYIDLESCVDKDVVVCLGMIKNNEKCVKHDNRSRSRSTCIF